MFGQYVDSTECIEIVLLYLIVQNNPSASSKTTFLKVDYCAKKVTEQEKKESSIWWWMDFVHEEGDVDQIFQISFQFNKLSGKWNKAQLPETVALNTALTHFSSFPAGGVFLFHPLSLKKHFLKTHS